VFSGLASFVSHRPIPILITCALLLALAIPISSLVPERLRASATKIRDRQANLISGLLEDRFGVRPVERTVLVSRSGLNSTDPNFDGVVREFRAGVEGRLVAEMASRQNRHLLKTTQHPSLKTSSP
jgi:putative drug exporter of the RND superfamily